MQQTRSERDREREIEVERESDEWAMGALGHAAASSRLALSSCDQVNGSAAVTQATQITKTKSRSSGGGGSAQGYVSFNLGILRRFSPQTISNGIFHFYLYTAAKRYFSGRVSISHANNA